MANPNSSGSLDELRKLLDQLADVHPKCMPDVIAGQWAVADLATRRKIEEAIDRMPKRKKPN